MKIKQTQKTVRFDARLLRTIVSRAHAEAKRFEGHFGKRAWKNFVVEIGAARQPSGSSGYTFYRTAFMRINIPVTGDATRRVAYVASHELMHAYGYKHRQGVNASKEQLDRMCAGLPERVLPVAPRVKPKRDLPAERYARLLEREVKWQRKAKRAETELKKIRFKRRYYERALDDARKAACRRGDHD